MISASRPRTYDPSMYTSVKQMTVGARFHSQFARTVTELDVAENYFLQQALVGRYVSSTAAGLPLYLAQRPSGGRLTLVDGSFVEYLRSQPTASLRGFAISNICEWLDADGIDALFAEIVRTATDGAILCFRNFLGWTEVPARWKDRVVEDRPRGEALFARDRSLVNRRFALCVIAG